MDQEMTEEQTLSKAYNPKDVERKWYVFWEEGGYFKADEGSGKPPYCISIPPPNVTGKLHMGHAIGDTLQDTLVRWKRMLGYETLWVPGTDHAGIATQTVVERHLIEKQGRTRKEYRREEFLAHVWEWKERSQADIIEQIKRLGCSCDWSRLRFTMDEGCNRNVRAVFKMLFDKGLIYRGDYLVNWDPQTQTALADDEVEYEERQGSLWTIKYALEEGDGYVRIATTRPETMLGDVAVAVSPRDERYAHLVGRYLIVPLVNRRIPIIADHFVDPEFGTGAVKVTPAHDPNDYQIGLRHNLPQINVMTPDGRINELGQQFAGLPVAEARRAVVEALESLHVLEGVQPHVHRVGISYRSKAVIEPYLSKQWFVKMEQFGHALRRAVSEGRVKLVPRHWESTYFHWIDNLRDWCISRQLWWGHRIPIWYNRADPEQMICYDGEGEPPQVRANPEGWWQDEDVLDTWFSSALWPLSILDWPQPGAAWERFYPNGTLVTGHDILFFWVARMILMGEYLTGQPPFPEVFLHGLIFGKSYWRQRPGGGISYLPEQERIAYDLGKALPPDVSFKWEKMSKTKGNVIDPLEIIEEYGADAMRMALCASASQAREIDLDRRRFEDYKNFANKLWNGARFTLMNLSGALAEEPALRGRFLEGLALEQLDLEDRWLLSKLGQTVRDVNAQLEQYAFDQAATLAYDFFWKELCAYYLEIAKPVLNRRRGTAAQRDNKLKLLAIALCQAVRLLHPMAPFVTEELFQRLKECLALDGAVASAAADPYSAELLQALQAPACIVAPYPRVLDAGAIDEAVNAAFDTVGEVIYAIRNLRGEMKLPPGEAVDVYISGDAADGAFQLVERHRSIIEALVKLQSLQCGPPRAGQPFGASAVVAGLRVFIPLPVHLRQRERERLVKELARLEGSLGGLDHKLANEEFIQKAPPALVEGQRQQARELRAKRAEMEALLRQIDGA